MPQTYTSSFKVRNKMRSGTSAIGTIELCRFLGVSLRRLDYAVRNSVLDQVVGTGNKRSWKADSIRRIQVAVLLAKAAPGTVLSELITEAAHAEIPPDNGYAFFEPTAGITYSDDPPVVQPGEGGIIVHLDEMWPMELNEPEVDEPPPDDGFTEIDDYDPELNMNQDAPVSYYEGPDTHEEAEGLR